MEVQSAVRIDVSLQVGEDSHSNEWNARIDQTDRQAAVVHPLYGLPSKFLHQRPAGHGTGNILASTQAVLGDTVSSTQLCLATRAAFFRYRQFTIPVTQNFSNWVTLCAWGRFVRLSVARLILSIGRLKGTSKDALLGDER